MGLRRGEVYWVSFDPSVGEEIRKTRPAVIISNNAANLATRRYLVVPMTTNITRVYPGEVLVHLNGVQSKAMADQLTTASVLRFKGLIGSISDKDMSGVERAVLFQLGLHTRFSQ